MKKILKDKWYWLTLGLMSALFYVLNLNTAMWGDDYLYTLLPKDWLVRCTTVGQYIKTMPAFYMHVNGRIADMMLRFTTSLLGMQVFNVMNTLVFALMVHLMASIVSRKRSVWLLLLIEAYVLLLIPFPGETMLWMAGAFNYMWSCTATLAVVKLLLVYGDREDHDPLRWWQGMLLGVAGFVAGAMNESFSAAVVAGLVCYCTIYRKKLCAAQWIIIVAYVLGLVLVVLSPGAWARLDTGAAVNFKMGTMQLLTQRVYNLMTKTCHFITPVLGFVVVALLLWRKGIKHASSNVLHWLLAGAMVSVLVFGLITYRAYMWYSVVGLLVIAVPLASWLDERVRWQRVLAAVCTIACIYPAVMAVQETAECKAFDDQMVSDIMESPDGVVLARRGPSRANFCHVQNYDNRESTWRNQFMSRYYGKDNVQFVDSMVYAHYKDTCLFMDGAQKLDFASSYPQYIPALYSLGKAGCVVAPVDYGKVTEDRGGISRMYFKDLAAYVGSERIEQQKLYGTYREFVPCRVYHLMRDGKAYLVAPALSDSVVSIDIDARVDGKELYISFTRK